MRSTPSRSTSQPGEIVAVIGGSGCGKSTLLRAISGLDTPTQGAVRLDDMTITKPHEKIGIIFQEPRLLPWLTVADNVGFGIEDRPKAERAERVARALDRVGLSDKAKVWPRELSGGQAQRVAIARALVPRPEVLLLDEPFSALDAFTRVDLQDHLLNLWNEFKPTLVMVTHDVEEAIVLADRIVVMRPHPGQVADEIEIDLPRPRDRQSAAFDFAKRRVLAALDRSLDRAVRRGASRAEGRPGRGDVVVTSCRVIPGRARQRAMPGIHSPCVSVISIDRGYGFRLSLRSAGMTTTAPGSTGDDRCAASRSAPAASRFSATNIRRPSPPAPRCC